MDIRGPQPTLILLKKQAICSYSTHSCNRMVQFIGDTAHAPSTSPPRWSYLFFLFVWRFFSALIRCLPNPSQLGIG